MNIIEFEKEINRLLKEILTITDSSNIYENYVKRYNHIMFNFIKIRENGKYDKSNEEYLSFYNENKLLYKQAADKISALHYEDKTCINVMIRELLDNINL